MNHLQEAKDEMQLTIDAKDGTIDWELGLTSNSKVIGHALIAIAEQQEIQTDKIVNTLIGATNSMDRIAEQLERMNDRNETFDKWDVAIGSKECKHITSGADAGATVYPMYEEDK